MILKRWWTTIKTADVDGWAHVGVWTGAVVVVDVEEGTDKRCGILT